MTNIDIVIISSGHSEYKSDEIVNKILKLDPLFIYDTIGLLTNVQISKLKENHEISILGRGDI